jgi:hypothetical protein
LRVVRKDLGLHLRRFQGSRFLTQRGLGSRMDLMALEDAAHVAVVPGLRLQVLRRARPAQILVRSCIVKSFRSRRSFISSPLWKP